MIAARNSGKRWMSLAAAALACGAMANAAQAEGFKILTAGALKPVVSAVAIGFEKETGRAVSVENDTAGALTKRLEAGDACDVTLLPTGALDAMAAKGLVDKASARPVARVGIGVAVAANAPKPDISTVPAFKDAVLAAPSVAYLDPAAGGSSGVYLTGLFKQLGITDQVAKKAVLVPGGLVAQRVVDGRATLAIHQISEIMAVPGATLVGPLPPEIQSYTNYSAAVCSKTTSPQVAAAFINELRTPGSAAMFKLKGMEPMQ